MTHRPVFGAGNRSLYHTPGTGFWYQLADTLDRFSVKASTTAKVKSASVTTTVLIHALNSFNAFLLVSQIRLSGALYLLTYVARASVNKHISCFVPAAGSKIEHILRKNSIKDP